MADADSFGEGAHPRLHLQDSRHHVGAVRHDGTATGAKRRVQHRAIEHRLEPPEGEDG